MSRKFLEWRRNRVELMALPQAAGCHRYVSSFRVPEAPGVPGHRLLRQPQLATGQGTSAREARLKAAAEAAERYSLVFQGTEDWFAATFDEIAGDAVHPHDLTQFSERQYAERDEWNRGRVGFPQVPYRYESHYPLRWYGAWSLTHDRPRCVPLQHVFMACTPEDWPMFQVCDSIGCAAGATDSDAFTRAFLELVERDALSIWWCNRLRRPALDRLAFDSPETRRLCKSITSDGREMALLDLTTDLEIPVVAAVTWDSRGSNVAIGAGAHFDARRAVRRALTEAVQVGHDSGSLSLRHARRRTLDGTWARWSRRARVGREPHLASAGVSGLEPAEVAADEDLADECLKAARRAGLEVIAVRLTRPEVGLAVVRVIVPGLRHPWLRLAPGRLYDVPVRMGWLARPHSEEEMNPHPLAL